MMDDAKRLLFAANSVVIITHQRPDGDAIGSQLGLGLFLRSLGKTVTMINADPVPGNIDWLTSSQDILLYDGSIDQRSKVVSADLIVIVDVNQKQRIGQLSIPVAQSLSPKLLIDHHLNPEDWFDASYVRTDATSAGELVYDLIEEMAPENIDFDMATALYTAIMTDTGSFRFDTVSARTHRIIADLIERGELEPHRIHVQVYDNKTKAGLVLYARVLETLHLSHGGKVGSMILSVEMLTDTGAHSDEAEGFVNSILSIAGVEVAVLFLELERGVKMSFRSKGEWAVNRWASRFGGGGHRNAAGAFTEGTLEEVVPAVLEAVDTCVPEASGAFQS